MKRLTAILCSLLLVFSSGMCGTASGGDAPVCEGCGCAAASCCTPVGDGGEQPAAPRGSDRYGGVQKLLASVNTVFGVSRRAAPQGPLSLREFADQRDVAVPIYLRHGRFLI